MSKDFEELDFRETPLGELTLRRRRLLSLGDLEIFEVKLGDAFLMSSLFHEVEVALADFGLGELDAPAPWDVVVGGLGLGYTAVAALEHEGVGSLLVVDALDAVIAWHRGGLVPLGKTLTADPRCRLVHGDFFRLADSKEGFDLEQSGTTFSRGSPRHRSFTARPAACAPRFLLSAGGIAEARRAITSARYFCDVVG